MCWQVVADELDEARSLLETVRQRGVDAAAVRVQ
jgi:hypothetical protein